VLHAQIRKEITPIPDYPIESSIKIDERQYKNIFSNMHENCCSITISLQLDNLGQILYSSRSSTDVFKHDYQYIKNFNVSTLMPNFISESHQDILLRFFYS